MKAEFAWHGGDRPGHLDFRFKLPDPITEAIKQALAPSFPFITGAETSFLALRLTDGPVGRYLLTTPNGSWFVRVSSRWGNPELERSITQYLASEGVSVNPLFVAGVTLTWEGQNFRVDVRPVIEGRHFDNSVDDLSNVASTLSACHQALVNFPQKHKVQDVASNRYQRLAEVRDLIADALRRGAFELFAERTSWASSHRSWLTEMVEQYTPRLDEYPGAQCIHGEVHPGNVLFRENDSAAVLVDFEESVHVFAPPVWDLAFLVQRFCLRDDPSPSVVLQRLAVVAEAYGSPLPNLTEMMRQAAWFSMAIIVDLRISQGVITPLSEYDKFVKLERQARVFEEVL